MGCTSSKQVDDAGAPGSRPTYFTLSTLGGRTAFGPFIKFVSYNPASYDYALSVLIVSDTPSPPTLQYATSGHNKETKSSEGVLLYSFRGYNFYKFLIETSCGAQSTQLEYQVQGLPSHHGAVGHKYTINIPAVSETWHWAFYSCNGFHSPQNEKDYNGIQPLWKDVLKQHKASPFHLMVGGGDQLYNDNVFDGPLIKGWDGAATDAQMDLKIALPFTVELQNEAEEFYFSHYAYHFTQPAFGEALATIPSLMTWDDHDIFDGWGSYFEEVQSSNVMQGIFKAAKLFYLLFQLHTTADRLEQDGYWGHNGAAMQLALLGSSTAVVMLDSRMERTQKQIVSMDNWRLIQQKLASLPASTRNVVVVLAVPILYPELPVQSTLQSIDNVSTGDSIISEILQKTGLASAITKRFGMVEILDDIIDHWDSSQHVKERDYVLQMLTGVAKAKGIRVQIISGDVHCAGYGMFYTRPEEDEAQIPLAQDQQYIPQIISSAIGNCPPPGPVLTALQAEGLVTKLARNDLIQKFEPLFGPPGELSSILRGKRNWCEVLESSASDTMHQLQYNIRCEKEPGNGQVEVFKIAVPSMGI